jgi:glycosyltransferase involved in cell wall biosynthesis
MLEGWLRAHDARMPDLAGPIARAAPRARTVVSTRQRPSGLLVWPVGGSRLVVIEDDGTGDEIGDGAVPPHLADGLLRFVRLAESALPEQGSGSPILLGEGGAPIRLAWWGRKVRDRLADGERERLRGATLLFPQSDVARVLKRRAIRRFQALGIAELIFLDPDRERAQLIRLQLGPLKSRWRSARHTLQLWWRSHGTWHWSRAWHVTDRVRARPVTLKLADKDPDPARVPRDYVLFEGLTAMVPAGPTDGVVGEPQRGQYAIDARTCRFAPLRPRWWPPRLHWIAPLDAATWRLFDCVPTVRAAESVLDSAATARDGSRPLTSALTKPRRDFADAVGALVRGPGAAAATESQARSRRIVTLTGSLSPGGAERQWCYLAAGLKSLGYDVTFVTMDALEGPAAHYLPMLATHGIEPVSLARSLRLDDLAELARSPELLALHGAAGNPFGALLPAMVALLRTVRPAAVMAQMDMANLLAAIASPLAAVPRVVLSARSVNPTNFGYIDWTGFLPLYRAVAGLDRVAWTANSRGGLADYARWIGMPADRFTWIPNAIDPEGFGVVTRERRASVRHRLGLAPDAPVIAGVFRFTEEKQPLLFVEICAALVTAVPDLHVVIAGDGPLLQDARRHAQAHGVDRRFAFLGARGDVPEILMASDMLLHTARIEGMPNALMEAQAVGLPVVAFAVGGAPDVVADGRTGRLVAPDDRAAMIEVCTALLRNPTLRQRMGRAGAARMRDEFTIEAMANRFIAMLDEPVTQATPAMTLA